MRGKPFHFLEISDRSKSQQSVIVKRLNGTPRISLVVGSANIWGTYNLEDIVTFSVGGKRAGKWQGRAVSAPTLIPFAGRAI